MPESESFGLFALPSLASIRPIPLPILAASPFQLLCRCGLRRVQIEQFSLSTFENGIAEVCADIYGGQARPLHGESFNLAQ